MGCRRSSRPCAAAGASQRSSTPPHTHTWRVALACVGGPRAGVSLHAGASQRLHACSALPPPHTPGTDHWRVGHLRVDTHLACRAPPTPPGVWHWRDGCSLGSVCFRFLILSAACVMLLLVLQGAGALPCRGTEDAAGPKLPRRAGGRQNEGGCMQSCCVSICPTCYLVHIQHGNQQGRGGGMERGGGRGRWRGRGPLLGGGAS